MIRHLRKKRTKTIGNQWYRGEFKGIEGTRCGADCTLFDLDRPTKQTISEICPDCLKNYEKEKNYGRIKTVLCS